MARIRVIHPSFWVDHALMPSLQKCLFLGLYNHSDDAGVFEWNPKVLRFKILPNDKVNVGTLLNKLEASGLIVSYEVDGKQYGEIIGFSDLQRTKNPVYKYPENPSKVVRKGDESSAKVVQKEDESKTLLENYNKNNNLQKKLPTDKDKDKDKEPPCIPPGENIIMLNPQNNFYSKSLSFLLAHTKKSEERCRYFIGEWMKLVGDWEVVSKAIGLGISKDDPITYIEKVLQNHKSEQKRKAENEKYTNDPEFQKLGKEDQGVALVLLKGGTSDWMLKHFQNHNLGAWKYWDKQTKNVDIPNQRVSA